jgi:hypothetical protein
LAPELLGTWEGVSLEANGIGTDCPGVIEFTDDPGIACGTNTHTFNADGTCVGIRTTDQFGDPDVWRWEGTWFTRGSSLTMTTTKEGPDGGDLQPTDPPRTTINTWGVSGDTLAISGTLLGRQVTWYWNRSTHEDGNGEG